MIQGIQMENGDYGCRAVITSVWRPEMAKYLRSRDAIELELNYAKGWVSRDLSFLSELPFLVSFKITDWRISDIEPIHCLLRLRQLRIATDCRTEIRFTEFPQLEDCGLEWRRKAKSVFNCLTLKTLSVNRYHGQDVMPFGNLVNLEHLAIGNAPVNNLGGLGNLKRLRSLYIAGLRRLSSLKGIEVLTTLEELEINTCRAIGSIDEFGSLRRLRELWLNNDGEIKSLKPLVKLPDLEVVGFIESTNVLDGDLSALLELKKLRLVAFQNRRHYSHRCEDFEQMFRRE